MSGAGRCTTLQCHYHAWTYGLDGALRAAPRADGDPGVRQGGPRPAAGGARDLGPADLRQRATRTRRRSPRRSATCRRSWPRGGLDVDALAFHARFDYSLEANWKVAVENYLECYHCAVAHPSLAEAIDVHPERYRLASRPDLRLPLRGAARRRAHRACRASSTWSGRRIKVNVMPGRPNLSIGPLLPSGPDRTDGFLDYFFAPGEDAQWIEDFLALDFQVGAEDRVLVESVQRGMASGVFDHGRLLLPSEELIAEFQRWVVGRLDGGGSHQVAREAELPRAGEHPLVALEGVEPLGDVERRRRRRHARVGLHPRPPCAAAQGRTCSARGPRRTGDRRP